MIAYYHPDSARHKPLHRIAGGELRPTFETVARIELLQQGLQELSIPLAMPDVDAA